MSTFTHWSVPADCSKGYDLTPANDLVKVPVKMFKFGSATKSACDDLEQFAAVLRDLKPGAFLTAGVSKSDAPIQEQARRLKSAFPFPYGQGLLILDGDDLDKYGITTTEQYVEKIRSLDPALQSVGFVTSSSASSFVTWPNGENGLRGLHAYAFIDNAAKVPHVIAALERICMEKGEGYARAKVASNGRVLYRSLVDAVMKSPHQVCFEGGSRLLSPSITQAREIKVFPGGMLYAAAINTGDGKQSTAVKKFKAQWRNDLQAQSAERAAAWAEKRIKAMTTKGMDDHDARGLVATMLCAVETDKPLHQDLPEQWVIHLDDGREVTVGEIAEDPNAFDGVTCSDPIEPEEGNCKAIIYANAGKGKPVIHSMLRGGDDCFYLKQGKNLESYLTSTFSTNSTQESESIDSTGFDGFPYDKQDSTSQPKKPQTPRSNAFLGQLLYTDDEGKTKRLIQSKARDRLIPHLSGRFAWSAAEQTWYSWRTTHWGAEETQEAFGQALHALIESGTDYLGFTVPYFTGIGNLIQLAGSLPPPPEETPEVLPFTNGLLNLKSRALSAATPSNALTWCLPYDYSQSADCPNIKTWLLRSLDGDRDMVEYVRAWLAAILTGRADLQRFIYLKGPGGTGKSTLIRLATLLVGQHNAYTTSLKELESGRFELGGAFGKRLVSITDAGRYGGSVDTLKAMVGQDPLRLERKNKQQCGSFTFHGIVILASNEDLVTTDLTSGLDRRRAVIPFTRIVPEAEKSSYDHLGGFEAVINAELPGLVNWLLELSRDQVTALIKTPPAQTASSNHFAMMANSPVARWLCEWCVPSPDAVTVIGKCEEIRADGRITYENADFHLYPNYLRFANSENIQQLSRNRFKETMVDAARTLGVILYDKRKAGLNVAALKGVRLRGETENPFLWIKPVKASTYGDSKIPHSTPETLATTGFVENMEAVEGFNYFKKKTTAGVEVSGEL